MEEPAGSQRAHVGGAIDLALMRGEHNAPSRCVTRRETLVMAARLRLPADMPDGEKEERVEGLIKRLGLTGAADTVVGDEKARDA